MKIELLIIAAGLMACSQAQTTSNNALPGSLPGAEAKAGEDIVVSKEMLDVYLGALPEETREEFNTPDRLKRLEFEIVRQERLYLQAVSRSLQDDPRVQKQLILAQREAMVNALLEQVVAEASTDEALQTWYNEHLVQFRTDQVHLSIIEVATEKDALELKTSLAGGADFAQLANEKHTGPPAAEGGDIGWIDKRMLGPDLGAKVSAVAPGEIVGPEQSPRGWTIMKVHEARDIVPFEEAKETILSQQTYTKEVVENYIASLEPETAETSADDATQDAAKAAIKAAMEEAAAAGGAAPAAAPADNAEAPE